MNSEEHSPLLEEDVYKGEKNPEEKDSEQSKDDVVKGIPIGHADVVGAPVSRTPWSTGLFSCFGCSGDYVGTDAEVCVLGTFAPCILYGSNIERLGASSHHFGRHCCAYTGFWLFGNFLFNSNAIAPLFTFPARTALRRKFNLEGSYESTANCFGCGALAASDENREAGEAICDFCVHFCCHPCALCQEGREIRRRLPPVGFTAGPYYSMTPPTEQVMSP